MVSRLQLIGKGTLLAVLAAAPAAARAQRPPGGGGVTEAGLVMRQLDGVKRVLMIGAHPDDEDTNVLAYLARGLGAETAYLSLTRGDGGQNLIGPELGEGLGVIRTGELEAARALDGATQFFGRAFDYGFSKSADEAFRHWPREELLEDVVRVIRRFRPQVVITVWSGTPRDGHGQHQAAGIVAIEAFAAAAAPERFPGVGDPWRADKLFQTVRFAPRPGPVRIQTGAFDPLLGRSYLQLAMESRSQHRSQDMGAPRPLGPYPSGLTLLESRVDTAGAAPGIFAGVDTTLAGQSGAFGGPEGDRIRHRLASYRQHLESAENTLELLHPERAAPPLARAVEALREASDLVARVDPAGETGLARELARRMDRAGRALSLVGSIVYDVRVNDDLVAEGDEMRLDVSLWNGGPFGVTAEPPSVRRPRGDWDVELVSEGESETGPAVVPSNDLATWTYRVRVPRGAEPSELYYLERPRQGDLYVWGDEPYLGDPRDPPLVEASTAYRIDVPDVGPVSLKASSSAEYVGVDKAQGEFRRPLLVTPALSVGVEPAGMAWPLGLREARTVRVQVRSEAAAGTRGHLELHVPTGWEVEPSAVPFEFEAAGISRAYAFTVRPGAAVGEGVHVLRAVAVTDDGRRFDRRVDVIDYPHVPRSLYFAPATSRISVFPVRVTEGRRVGYIMGSGDDGLEALRQLGADAVEIGPDAVRAGDFSGYDAVVLGIRVYETRPDVAAVNQQLLDFARAGGTVVVQYNKYEYPAGDYAPYPVSMGRRPVDRVTDENSPVGFVDARSPVLTTPNRIVMADFEGWVQERGLYFLTEWDDRFTPVLALTDPGEAPKRGSVLVAPVGEGVYVYAALSFFRQFPAGVPGAYRLFANLVSLDGASWRAYLADSR